VFPPPPPPRGRSPLQHPARLITSAFAAAIAVGTLLLMLPMATTGAGGATATDALFTATSAITVTGLGVVDTATHWSTFGEVVILALIQLGGLGIMTLASIVLVGLSGRIGLRQRLIAQQEVGVLTLGEVGSVVRAVLRLTVAVEAVAAVALGLWFFVEYEMGAARSAWHGLFHAVSAFNNAGFALYSDSLVRFVHDPVVNVVVMVAIVLGGLGVPVLGELARDRLHWSKWSLHTKLVLVTSGALILVAWIAIAFLEWTNTSTLGPMSAPESLLASLFQAVTPRTAGFNTIDFGSVREATLLFTSALMFIGAGPASTGGGIKVTTFAMLAFVILSEMRGDRDVVLFNRRIPTVAQRQGLSIALIGVGVVFVTTLLLVENAGMELGDALFEVTSAFGTVGLSTGVTADVPGFSRLLLIVLMFAGRVGPLTVGTALAVRSRDQRFRYPEERPLIG
jgi:trk system potassium uptake protein